MENTRIKTDGEIENEIKNQYGSISKMVALVSNETERLIKFEGQAGRDRAEVVERALWQIPSKYHGIYFKYRTTLPRP